MKIYDIFDIVGRVTKDIDVTHSYDGQLVAHMRIAVERNIHSKSNHSVYMNLSASGPIGQAMADTIKRGMYVKLTVYDHDFKCSCIKNKPYGVLHFEKLYKQAYNKYQPYQPGGHKDDKDGKVVHLALEDTDGEEFDLQAYAYCSDDTPASIYCIFH